MQGSTGTPSGPQPSVKQGEKHVPIKTSVSSYGAGRRFWSGGNASNPTKGAGLELDMIAAIFAGSAGSAIVDGRAQIFRT